MLLLNLLLVDEQSDVWITENFDPDLN